MNIKLYKQVWFDCYSAFLNNIIYSLGENRMDTLYCNNYVYLKVRQEMDWGKAFISVNSRPINLEEIEKYLFKSKRKIERKDKDELFCCIMEHMEKNHLILALVDMFDYLPSISSIYHKQHLEHFSYLRSYNEKTKMFTIFEQNIEMLTKDKLLNACLAQGGILVVYELHDSIQLPLISLETVLDGANNIVKSINDILYNFDIWIIDEPTMRDIDYFLAVADTHLDSIKYRNYANSLFFSNIIQNKEIEAVFKNIEEKVQLLQLRLLKACVRHKGDQIEVFRKALLEIFLAEKNAWKLVHNLHNNKLLLNKTLY